MSSGSAVAAESSLCGEVCGLLISLKQTETLASQTENRTKLLLASWWLLRTLQTPTRSLVFEATCAGICRCSEVRTLIQGQKSVIRNRRVCRRGKKRSGKLIDIELQLSHKAWWEKLLFRVSLRGERAKWHCHVICAVLLSQDSRRDLQHRKHPMSLTRIYMICLWSALVPLGSDKTCGVNGERSQSE